MGNSCTKDTTDSKLQDGREPSAILSAAQNAVLGAFVADASTMGLHWIYDQNKILDLTNEPTTTPEFFEPPSCPFYTLESGSLSPYGDEQLQLLTYFTTVSTFDPSSFCDDLFKFYSEYSGRQNHLIKEFMKAMVAGKNYPQLDVNTNDNQAHAINKASILAAKYYPLELDAFVVAVNAVISTDQPNDVAMEYGLGCALILRHIVTTGSTIKDALQWASSDPHVPSRVQASIVQSSASDDVSATIQSIGLSCALPGAFEGALVVLNTAQDFQSALRLNIMAGGDNCSRAMFIGACFAAAENHIPTTWCDQTKSYAHLTDLINKMMMQI